MLVVCVRVSVCNSSQVQRRLRVIMRTLLHHDIPHRHRLLLHLLCSPALNFCPLISRGCAGVFVPSCLHVHASSRAPCYCCTGRWQVCYAAVFSLRACLHYVARQNHSPFKINRIHASVTASEYNIRTQVGLAVLTQPQRHRCPRYHGRIYRLPATSHWHSQSGV